MLEQVLLVVYAIEGMLMGAVLGLQTRRPPKADLEALAARLVIFRLEQRP